MRERKRVKEQQPTRRREEKKVCIINDGCVFIVLCLCVKESCCDSEKNYLARSSSFHAFLGGGNNVPEMRVFLQESYIKGQLTTSKKKQLMRVEDKK